MQNYPISKTVFCDKIMKRILNKLPDFYPYNMLITPNSMIHEDLNMDSLDIVETVMEIEKKYNIKIHYNRVGDFQTVNDLYKSFIKALNKKNRKINMQHQVQRTR